MDVMFKRGTEITEFNIACLMCMISVSVAIFCQLVSWGKAIGEFIDIQLELNLFHLLLSSNLVLPVITLRTVTKSFLFSTKK